MGLPGILSKKKNNFVKQILANFEKKWYNNTHGDIAQPGERSPHTRKVTSSSLVASIFFGNYSGLVA